RAARLSTASAVRLRPPAPGRDRGESSLRFVPRSSAGRHLNVRGPNLMRRQQDGDLGAFAQFAVNADGAFVGEDYSLAQRQSQAHSRPCGLGREERVEYTFEMLARDADAVVDDADHDERPVAALPAGLVLGDYADRAALALGRVGG